MMGTQAAPEQLFFDFCMEDHVPTDHLPRQIDSFLDLSEVRATLKPFCNHLGRPSVNPELMIRVLIVGYCLGRSCERRLCEEVQLNLSYLWFCGLGLKGKVPDHSTFSANRNGRFGESDLFRQVFEATVRRCMSEDLVGGDGFAVDASLIRSDANKKRSIPNDEWEIEDMPSTATQAVKDYLETLDDADFGVVSPTIPKSISPSDPAAQWTGARRGPAFFAYATNCLGDNAIA